MLVRFLPLRTFLKIKGKIMTKRKEIHVTHRDDGKWQGKKPENSRASFVCDTKAKALQKGKEIARHEQRELIPHNLNGRISNPNSYGNDPCPPGDKKN